MNKGIVIKGSAIDPSAAVVQSAGADAVFVINAPNVGFQNLTIAPTRVRAGGTPGALGIRFAAPVSATTEAAVTNIVIAGITKSTLTEPTGAGIEVAGGTSPTIGPGVTIIGGTHSLLVTQAAAGTPAASRPVITSTASAPTLFRAAELACVRIESANAAAIQMPSAILNATAPNRRHLMDCGGSGAIVVDTVKAGVTVDVTNTLIDATTALPPTPPPATNYGIRLLQAGRLTVNGGLVITGITELVPAAGAASAAIEAGGTSTLTINGTPLASPSSVPNVSVTNNKATGVHVLGNASATITGLSSTSNKLVGATGQHGLLCDAAPSLSVATNLTLRGSLFLDNEVHGVFVRGAPGGVGCAADLGSAASVGANIYNTTTLQNGKVGLCYTVVSASGAVASSSAWGCGLAMSVVCTAAMAATPKPTVVANCDSVGDYNAQPGAGGLAVALPQMCCGK